MAKISEKKPAVSKTAPVVQKSSAPVKKPTVPKAAPAAQKSSTPVKKTAVPEIAPAANTPKVMNLFDAFTGNKLPKDQGYIVSSFINAHTGYAIYEVLSYSGVKAIYTEGPGLTFQSQGKKLHALIEPASYAHKGMEPYLREKADQIPLRFTELKKSITRNQSTIYFAHNPIESLSSFTIARPQGLNISFVFYNRPDLYVTLAKFFEQSFVNDVGIPMNDAKKNSLEIAAIVKKTMNFTGQYV
jgi:hypothetical protein